MKIECSATKARTRGACRWIPDGPPRSLPQHALSRSSVRVTTLLARTTALRTARGKLAANHAAPRRARKEQWPHARQLEALARPRADAARRGGGRADPDRRV